MMRGRGSIVRFAEIAGERGLDVTIVETPRGASVSVRGSLKQFMQVLREEVARQSTEPHSKEGQK